MFRTMRAGAAAIGILVLAASAPAAADEAGERLFRSFVESIDATAEWTATTTTIRSEGTDTIAEGFVVRRHEPEVAIKIKQLRLSALTGRAGGGFTASAVQMDGGAVSLAIAIEGDPAMSTLIEYAVPKASVKDVSIPGTAGIGFDPHHLMRSVGELYSVMAKAEFRDFSVPEIAFSQNVPTPGAEKATVRGVYRNLTMAGMTNGVAGRTEAGPILFSGPVPEGGEFRIEVAKITSGEMDMAAIARILDAREYKDGRGDGIWRPIVSDVGYSGLSGTGPDGATFRLENISLGNLEGRQPEQPFVDAFDKLLDPTISPEEKTKDFDPSALLAFYAPWRLGTFSMEGLSMNAPKDQVSFELAAFSLSGLSNEGIDELTLSKLSSKQPGAFLSLDSLELEEFVFADLSALMKLAEKQAAAAPSPGSTDDVRSMLAALPRLSHFGLHGLAGGMSPAEAVTLDSFTVDLTEWNDIFAGSVAAQIDELYIPRAVLQKDPRAAEAFRALDFDRLVLGMSLEHDWSPTEGTNDFTFAVTVEDGADLEVSYSLTGVTSDWLFEAIAAKGAEDTGGAENNNEAWMALIAQLGFAGASVTVTDDSLLDRAFEAAVTMQKLDVDTETYKQQTREALPFLISSFVPAEIAELVNEPIQAFLEGGQKLVADVSPAEPVPLPEILAGLVDALGLIDRLQLSITSEPAPQ